MSDVINHDNDKKDYSETTNNKNATSSSNSNKNITITKQNATASSSNSNKNITITKHTSSYFPGGASTSDTRACAACKYQRKRCAPTCILAPYFPPDHQKQFFNVHRLFGVRNMMKVYTRVKPHQRHLAIKSMIFEADVRANDPVGGCHRIIVRLKKQLELYTAELSIVLSQLAYIHFNDFNDESAEPLLNPIISPAPGEQSIDLPQEPDPGNLDPWVALDHLIPREPEPGNLDPWGALDHLLGYKDEDIESHVDIASIPLLEDGYEEIKVLIGGGEDIKPDPTEYKNLNLSSEKNEPKDGAKISPQPQQKDVT